MSDVTTAALINAGGNVAAGAGNFLSNSFFGERNEQWAREDATTAYNRAVDQWKREVEYDSPKARMQRYVEAGLNPNLVYNDLGGGQIGLPSVPAAQSAQPSPPQLAQNMLSPLLEAQLMEAQIQRMKTQNKNETNLSEAQAYRIYRITPIEYQRISNDADLLKQKFESQEFQTAIEQLKKDLLEDGRTVGITTRTGPNEWEQLVIPFKDLVRQTEIDKLYASDKEYQYSIDTFLSRVGIIDKQNDHYDLLNKDLKAFVDVCERIYNSQAEQADYMASVAQLNKDFYNSLGASNDVVKLLYGFFELILGAVGSFVPKGGRSRRDVYVHQD